MFLVRPLIQITRRCVVLVLSRKIAQSLIIADNITVTILDCDRGQVRIGIEAPREINVARTELLERDENLNVELPLKNNSNR